jgi:ankyrin repeat protein
MSEALLEAIHAKDADRVTAVLAKHPDLASRLNQPLPGLHFGATALSEAVGLGDRAMIDALLRAGADINARSDWWAGSFGVLDFVDADLAEFLISRGAVLDLHAAARLGWVDRVRELIAGEPSRVHARGGDGQTPLHRAGSLEVARILIEHGADIDARDVDHESTPAQYQVREHPEIARELIARGCETDLLLLTALGDLPRVRAILDARPEAIHTAVDDESFPKRNPQSGGTIYQWTLGAHWNAHRVAREFGHREILALLMERSPLPLQLVAACETGDLVTMERLRIEHPDLVQEFTHADIRRLPDAARNADWGTVRNMLTAGWPLDARGQHGGMALHWVAWHGNPEVARDLASRGAPLDAQDHDFGGTPLTWAAHASVHGWHPDRGDHAGVVETLLDAGATPPSPDQHSGSEAVRAVLKRRS